MADIPPTNSEQLLQLDPGSTSQPRDMRAPPPPSVVVPQPPPGLRSGHLNLDTFSPVGKNGAFAFDRVLKSGEVHKRTRKTKVFPRTPARSVTEAALLIIRSQQWKSFHLVLRPNLLSLYKSHTEERLLKQISLSDLTAVAYLKDPKGRRQHLFGLYSPSRNWHLQAQSAAEALSWVDLIKHEARIDEEEPGTYVGSPTDNEGTTVEHFGRPDNDRFGSSSPEPLETQHLRHLNATRNSVKMPGIQRPSAPSLDYSGDEQGPYSDFSDTPPQSLAQQPGPFGSFINRKQRQPIRHKTLYAQSLPQQQLPPSTARNASQASGFHIEPQDEERVIWNGYLLYLKSKGGVRQWKRTWVVLRPKNLAFYKNDEVS